MATSACSSYRALISWLYSFGFIYLGISSYLDKRGGGNINHSAHFWGALYGMVFVVIASRCLFRLPGVAYVY